MHYWYILPALCLRDTAIQNDTTSRILPGSFRKTILFVHRAVCGEVQTRGIKPVLLWHLAIRTIGSFYSSGAPFTNMA